MLTELKCLSCGKTKPAPEGGLIEKQQALERFQRAHRRCRYAETLRAWGVDEDPGDYRVRKIVDLLGSLSIRLALRGQPEGTFLVRPADAFRAIKDLVEDEVGRGLTDNHGW